MMLQIKFQNLPIYFITFSVFGIPIILDDFANEEFIINDLLNQVSSDALERPNDFHIPENDFHSYLDYAKNLTVEFDSRAETMLRNYFIATKTIRPGKF